MLLRVALVKTEVSEEFSTSIIRVTRNGEIGTNLAVNSNLKQRLICERLHQWKRGPGYIFDALNFVRIIA
jgi:hypothetical protein